MPQVVCKQCGETRTLARVRKYADCKDCSIKLKKENAKTYFRVCDMCGDKKQYHYPPSTTRCLSCANKTRKEESDYKCKRVCIDCDKVDYLKTPHAVAKSTRCMSCASKHRIKTTPMPKRVAKEKENDVGVPPIRHFRVCPECGDCKQVALSGAGIKLCRKCSNIEVVKTRKPKAKKVATKKKRKKTYTPIGVDGQQKVNIRKPKVKFQVVDMDTMEAPVKKREKEEYPKSTPEQDAEMIAQFLKRRESNVN